MGLKLDKKQHIGYIANGINLDHIPKGKAFYILQVLRLTTSDKQMGVGLNLPSKKLGFKDLIKIEDYVFSPEELRAISLFAPGATLSVIENFEVIKKSIIQLPEIVDKLIICPNKRCVSHLHISKFKTFTKENKIQASCHYCEQEFLLNNIKEFNI